MPDDTGEDRHSTWLGSSVALLTVLMVFAAIVLL